MTKLPVLKELLSALLVFVLSFPTLPEVRADNATGLAHFGTSCGHLCTNADIFGANGERALESTRKAEEEGNRLGNQARDRGQLGDQIGKDLGGLRNNLSAIPPTPPEQAQQKREALLARSYQPPKQFREEVKKLELNTNYDLNEKGEKVQEQVYSEAKELQEQSQQKLTEAKKSAAAAKQLQALKGETLKRSDSMKNIGSQNILKAVTGKPNEGTGVSLTGSGAKPGDDLGKTEKISKQNSGSAKSGNEIPLSMARAGQLEGGRMPEDTSAGNDKDRNLKKEGEDKFMSQLSKMDNDLAKSMGGKLDAVESALQIAEGKVDAATMRGPASEGSSASDAQEESGNVQSASRARMGDANLFLRIHACVDRQQKRGNLLAGASK